MSSFLTDPKKAPVFGTDILFDIMKSFQHGVAGIISGVGGLRWLERGVSDRPGGWVSNLMIEVQKVLDTFKELATRSKKCAKTGAQSFFYFLFAFGLWAFCKKRCVYSDCFATVFFSNLMLLTWILELFKCSVNFASNCQKDLKLIHFCPWHKLGDEHFRYLADYYLQRKY